MLQIRYIPQFLLVSEFLGTITPNLRANISRITNPIRLMFWMFLIEYIKNNYTSSSKIGVVNSHTSGWFFMEWPWYYYNDKVMYG